MADNNTSDQSEKGKFTGVHPPASEELPSGGPFLEGQNQDDLSTYSNETTLTDKILNVPATGSDKTDTKTNAAMTHSNANKVSNSKSKFHESLPGNNSGAVTPENSSKLQERRQKDLQSGGEHSDTRCKNEILSHDSIQSSDTTVIPDDRREMDDHDSKRSPDIAGTPGDSHKGEDEDLTGSSDVASTPGDSHKGEDEDLTGSSDVASTSGDSHKGDNDLTRSPGITELSEYSDHILPDSPTTQFSPERAGANQTPASPSTSVVDNPGSPVVMSTPDNKFRTKYPHYESESGISQGESGIWSSQSEFGTGYNDTESGVGHSPSESDLGHNPSESGVGHSPSESGLGHNPSESGVGHSPGESGIEMSFSDQRNKRVKETIFLEERIRELEAKIHAKEEEKKLQEDKRVKETIFLEERIKELEAKIHVQEEENKLQGNHAEELENFLQKKDGLLKKIDDLQDVEVKNWELQKDIEERDSHIKRLQDKIEDLKGVEVECKSFKQKWEESLANQKDLEQRIQNLQSLEVEGQSFKQKWEESMANQKDLEQRIKNLQSVEVECKSFKQKWEESLANQKDLEQRIQNLQSVEVECKSFKQRLDESLANQKDLKQRIQNLQKEVNQSLDLKQQTDEKEKQLRNLQDQIKKLKDEHAQELNTLKKQFDEAKEKINEEMTRSSSEKHAKDVESLQKELNDTKQKAVKLQQKIVYLQAKEKEFNELKNKHDECEKSLQNLARLQDDHVTKTNELRENLMKQHQEELQHLQGTKAQCEEELASNKLILNNALLRELREKEEKDKCQHIIEEKRAEEVKILQERDRLEAELQSCRTKAKSSRTRCLLWKCVTYLRTLQLKNLENVYEGIVSEFEEQKRLNTTMQRALAESQEELDELNSKLQDERDAVSELQQDKATLEEKNAVLQDSHQQTKDQVSDRDQQIEKLKAQRKQLEKLKAKSDEQVMQAQVVNNTLQMQMVKLQHERVRENTLNESKISELTAQIRQREQQFLPLEMQVQQTMQELGSAHSRLEEVQDCNRTLKEELHKATAALTERGRQEEALQSKIQDLSLKNSRYLHELFTVRRDLSVVTEKLRRTEVWMR